MWRNKDVWLKCFKSGSKQILTIVYIFNEQSKISKTKIVFFFILCSSTRCWSSFRQGRRSRISLSFLFRCPSACSCGDCQDVMNFWLLLVSRQVVKKACRRPPIFLLRLNTVTLTMLISHRVSRVWLMWGWPRRSGAEDRQISQPPHIALCPAVSVGAVW